MVSNAERRASHFRNPDAGPREKRKSELGRVMDYKGASVQEMNRISPQGVLFSVPELIVQ